MNLMVDFNRNASFYNDKNPIVLKNLVFISLIIECKILNGYLINNYGDCRMNTDKFP